MASYLNSIKNFARSFIGGVQDINQVRPLYDLRIYKHVPTLTLLKNFSTYTLFKSNFFATRCMQIYTLFKLARLNRVTDSVIGCLMGSIFAGGNELRSVQNSVINSQKKNLDFTISYLDESYESAQLDEFQLDGVYQISLDTLKSCQMTGQTTMAQIRYSTLCNREAMQKLSRAQHFIKSLFVNSENGIVSDHVNGADLLEKFEKYNIKADGSEILAFISQVIDRELSYDTEPSDILIHRNELLNTLHAYYIDNEEMNEHPIMKEIARLTPQEHKRVGMFVQRLRNLLNYAQKNKIQVIAEGEQSYFQSAIDSITQQLTKEYNKENVVLINTIQNYLIDSKEKVSQEIENAKFHDVKIGLRMEIGFHAHEEYEMTEEKKARFLPILESKAETIKAMEENVKQFIETYSEGSKLVVDIDTLETSNKIVDLVNSSEAKDSLRRDFTISQNKGAGDYLANYWAREGYKTTRYIPYGKYGQMVRFFEKRTLQLNNDVEVRETHRRLIVNELMTRIGF